MIKITKEVENTNKNVAVRRVRVCTASTPQDMIIAGQASVAGLLNPVIPQSIPIQRNDELAVEEDHTVMSTDAPTHQNVYAFCHPLHFIPLLSLHTMCLPI